MQNPMPVAGAQLGLTGIAFADLHPETLQMARNSGTVQNLRDRRNDLYNVNWRRKSFADPYPPIASLLDKAWVAVCG